MGLNVYYSPKRKRKYIRKFDHYEAQERWRKGELVSKLAKEYGVTVERIYQVVSPKHKAWHEAYRERLKHTGQCGRCGKATNYFAQRFGSKLCVRCAADDRITTVRPDELRCGRCKSWLPDGSFGLYRAAPAYRRGRHHNCRSCEAKMRRERRHRAKAEGRATTLR